MMKSKKKRIHLVLIPFSFLILAFSFQPGISDELDKDPIKNDLFLAILHPVVVPIGKSRRVESVITLINLGSKPISLGKVDYRTGRLVGGDYELRVSVDISNAPLRHMQIGGQVAASDAAPFTSANLISGVTFMPGSELWMAVTALPADSREVPQGGDAKFTFTLLSSVDGKINTLIEMGFSMRYEKGKKSGDTTLIQASMKINKPVPAPNINISVPSIDEYVRKVEAAGGKAVMPNG
ncbi:MAG: hypothetical protein WBD99_04715 [Thermodesulfobacteriota bacterium]